MRQFCAVALAISSTATAAYGQSSATVYGLLDLSVQHIRMGERSSDPGGHLTRLEDGTRYGPGSRLGFRVKEDLGDGTSFGAVLEMGFNAGSGATAQGGRGFGRQSFISLASSRIGELRAGRQYALHDEVMAVPNPFGNTLVLNPGAGLTYPIGSVPMFIDAPRIDNLVHYLSPVVGGFRFQAGLAPGQGFVDRYQGVKGSYALVR
jgi:GBP family porin